MIPRRIADHVKAHNWFGVGVDLFIVVLGVFLGTQVSNWNAARQDRAAAAIYAERLTKDLRFEAWRYEISTAYYEEAHANARRTIAALTAQTPADGALSDEQLLISAYRASQYIFFGARRATFDELVATGDIGPIADQRLRETAISLFSNPVLEEARDASLKSDYRLMFRRITPADAQEALLRDCGDRDVEAGNLAAISGVIDYPCSLDLPDARIAAAASVLRGNAALLEALQLRTADIGTALQNFEIGDSESIANLRAIAQETAP